MSFILALLRDNHDLVQFFYGLEFFVLGLVIALQSRHYSRLELARSLKWLAAFNLLQSAQIWGEWVFPLQSITLVPETVEALKLFQLFLIAGSFTLLFEFGFAFFRPRNGMRLLLIPPLILLGWAFIAFYILRLYIPETSAWFDSANALARYMLAFPGGLLAAYQLKRYTLQHIRPLNVPHLIRTMLTASLALSLYAVLVGLIPPPVPFFPGNVINQDTFFQTFGLPPLVLRALTGLILTLTFIRALEIFEVETQRTIEVMEQQQILASERERIGRELHDGAIQMAYTAGLLVESAYRSAEPGSPIARRLESAANALSDTIDLLRQSLVDLQPDSQAEPLEESLRAIASDPRFRSLLDIHFTSDLPSGETLSNIRTDHTLAIVREALTNVVRHARARKVEIILGCQDESLMLKIEDDGTGLPHQLDAGYGMRNMNDRARLLGGTLEISNMEGKGTSLLLEIPRRDEI